MLGELALVAITAVSGYSWFPYNSRISNPAPEYYASVQTATSSSTIEFTDMNLADKIISYTGRSVLAYSQSSDSTPTKFSYQVGSNKPKINYITPLYNNYSSLITALNKLVSKSNLGVVMSANNINNVVLGYLRSLNVDYSDNSTSSGKGLAWRLCAGLQEPVDGSWDIIDANYRYHESVRDFFARYVPSDKYNSGDHGRCSSSSWPDGLNAIPDHAGEGNIDLIHMLATIDGAIDKTYYGSDSSYDLDGTNFQKDLLGWGGDLQTCANEGIDLNGCESFEDVMSKSKYFSKEDFLADVDGFSIAKKCDQKMTIDWAVSTNFVEVRDSLENRYINFANAMTEETTYDWGDASLNDKVIREAHAILGLKWNGSGYDDVYGSTNPCFYLLKSSTKSSDRQKLAELFSNYILDKAGLV